MKLQRSCDGLGLDERRRAQKLNMKGKMIWGNHLQATYTLRRKHLVDMSVDSEGRERLDGVNTYL